jgi:hypothetical protein
MRESLHGREAAAPAGAHQAAAAPSGHRSRAFGCDHSGPSSSSENQSEMDQKRRLNSQSAKRPRRDSNLRLRLPRAIRFVQPVQGRSRRHAQLIAQV